MKRALGAIAGLALLGAIVFALWPEPKPATPTAPVTTLPSFRESRWNAPIAARGERRLRGVVLREGQPAAGADVTAVFMGGAAALEELPCQCEAPCPQKLLARGCPEAATQLAELIAARTGEGIPVARTTTGPDGLFELVGLDDSTLTLWADAPDGVGWVSGVSTDAKDVKVQLRPGRVLEGTVVSLDGRPTTGALVTAVCAKQGRLFDAVADGNGSFRIGPIPGGEVVVVAMLEGLLPDFERVADPHPAPLLLELAAPHSLSGLVLRDGEPVSNLAVKLEGRKRARVAKSGSDGAFSFDRLGPGRYWLSAEAADATGRVDATIPPQGDLRDVLLELAHGEPVSGVVVDEGGRPVGGAEISFYDGQLWRKDVSAADGRFSFTVVPDGERRFTASKRGYLEAQLDSSEPVVRLTLGTATTVSGRVESSPGVVVPVFTISAERPKGVDPLLADDESRDSFDSTDGGFSLDLRPGKYDLKVETAQWAPTHLLVSAPARGVVIVLNPASRVTGQVLDPDGRPAAGVKVSATGDDFDMSQETDAQGRFSLGALPAGELQLAAEQAAPGASEADWRVVKKVALSRGQTLEVLLRPEPGVAIGGVVIDSTGVPVANAEVAGHSTAGPAVGRATTDATGHFRLRTLPAGAVKLTASRGLETGRLGVTAPDEHVVLKLRPATSVAGRVLDEKGAPVRAFSISLESLEGEDGRFEVSARVGDTELIFEAPGRAPLSVRLEVKPGRNELGDVRMSRGRAVSGVVLDAVTRAPVMGALLEARSTQEVLDQVYLSDRQGAKTDARGRFRLARVDPSATVLVATHDLYEPVQVSLPPNATRQDLTMKPGVTLIVRVLDAKGETELQARLSARGKGSRTFSRTPEGAFAVRGLTPGRWTVTIKGTPSRVWRPLSVEVGATSLTLEAREATDGVTVRVKVEGSEALALVRGDKSGLTKMSQLVAEQDVLEVSDGEVPHVLPGRWTVLAVRHGPTPKKMEISAHVIDVPPSGEAAFTFSPNWRQVEDLDLFGSSRDEDDDD